MTAPEPATATHRRATAVDGPSGEAVGASHAGDDRPGAAAPIAGLATGQDAGQEADLLGGTAASPEVTSVLRRRRGTGKPLPDEVAGRFGTALGADLSTVRIHADSEADTVSRAVQARAFTHGSDIYFSQGAYAPGNGAGDHLLAHELAHVAQRDAAPAGSGPVIGAADDPAEAAADRTATGVVAALRRRAASTPEPESESASDTPAPNAVLRRKKTAAKTLPKPKGKGNVIPGKKKDALEALVRKGPPASFTKLAAEVYQDHPRQFEELLAYKLSKHAANEDKAGLWRKNSPPEAVAVALDKVDVLSDTDSDGQRELIEKAAGANDVRSLASYHRTHPDLVEDLVAEKLDEGPPRLWASALDGEGMAHVAEKMGATNFIDKVLVPLRGELAMIELMRLHPLMSYLEKNAGKAFERFRDSTPMLKVAAKGRKNARKAGATEPLEIVDHVFDAFVRNEGIDLSYYTVSLDPSAMILTGDASEKDKAMAKAQRDVLNGPGQAGTPAKPATQCHNLLKTLEHVMMAVPGLKLTIKSEDVAGVTLTKPLAGLPQGLIDKSFKGNVFDERGRPTGQVCFTGNEGTQSHTWSLINGKPYDPVMGTKGDEVKNAVDGEFEQLRSGLFQEKDGPRYLIAEKELKATANVHGFGPGYRLTTTPPPEKASD